MSWDRQLRTLARLLVSARFWYTLLGVTLSLLVCFYLLYQAIEHFDRDLSLHATICGEYRQRNLNYLVIILLTPLFLIGVVGVIGEWMQFIDNRSKGRKTSLKALILFLVLMQVTGLAILHAMDC